LFLAAGILLAGLHPLDAQKFQPKTVQFKGDPEYSDKELLAASDLKPGAVVTSPQLNDRSKSMMGTGMFDSLTYKFDGADLIFSLIPASLLYPIRLENLPLTPGAELDAKLYDRFPLYHGKVPAEGGMLESARGALEDMLSAQGIKATVTAVPFGEPGTRKVSAMNFSVSTPPVRVGALELKGVSPPMAARVKNVADQATGTPFDTTNSATNLEHAFATFYADEGYAAVKVHAARSGDPVIGAAAVDIPYSVTVEEGRLYKLGAVHLPPDALVMPAEIDKVAGAQAQTVKGATMQAVWGLIATRYKSKGYLDFSMTPHPEFDETAGTVSYTVDLNPGPVYHLALLKFDNVSDDLRKLLMRNWQMLPGNPFDASYVSDFVLKAQKADPVLQRTLAAVKVSYDVRADPVSRDANLVIKLERR
jgi:outer membrane protein insertion porin family